MPRKVTATVAVSAAVSAVVEGRKAASTPRFVSRFARPQPLENVLWLPFLQIQPNNYNPNKMAPPELELLKVSLLADGWTQPVVLFVDNEQDGRWIVDGFHRWTLAATDDEVQAMTDGHVPIVIIDGDLQHRMMSTIRHNRARGMHGVVPMAEIVRKLLEEGVPAEKIQSLLGMEQEEIDRLAERAGVPAQISAAGKEKFNQGWEPGL